MNLIIDKRGVTLKEAQELARHFMLDMTIKVYGRVPQERLSEAIERAGKAILPLFCRRRTRKRNSR